VSYTFPGAKNALIKDLSIKIPAGQKVAVLGRMGSGKSYLRKTLRWLDPTHERIHSFGRD
jgi:ATP-binding cassette subfamily C protein LapB